MNENEKSLSEKVTEKMVGLLNEERSIFTKAVKEDGTSQFLMPINARTKQPYRGAAALVLIMQNRRDPRWLTYDQAKFNRTPVKRGAYGVEIEFNSTRELRQKVENGQPVRKEDGKPKMERIKLDEPVTVSAKMFNGKDLMNLKAGEVKTPELTPTERAQLIIDNSKVQFNHTSDFVHYDRKTDTVNMSPKESFESPELYYSAALHGLAHAATHESRLNAPEIDHPDFDALAKEELRTNIASIMLSAQLNLPYDVSEHRSFLTPWSQILQENPDELFEAANDAQKMADYVTQFERNVAQKVEVVQDQKQLPTGKLEVGLEIPYNNTAYKVLEKQSKGAFKIEDLTSRQKIKITPSMGLYKSLVNQLNNSEAGEKIDFKQDQQQGTKLEELNGQQGKKDSQQQENSPAANSEMETSTAKRKR